MRNKQKKENENPRSGLLLWSDVVFVGFHLNINNFWVGGIRSTVRLLLLYFEICFPHRRSRFKLSCPSRYWSIGAVSWKISTTRDGASPRPQLGSGETGLADPGITGGREGRTEREK